MWMVDRSINKEILSHTDLFVRDYFTWVRSNKGVTKKTLINRLKRDKSTLGKLAKELKGLYKLLVKTASYNLFEEIYSEYEKMTSDYYNFIENGAHTPNITKESLSLSREIYSYFYNVAFDRKSFWSLYATKTSNIVNSKATFRHEIGIVRPVCPYCDLNYCGYEKQSNTDHFLPISYFPMLAIHWENLIVSCQGCNQYIKGANLIGSHLGKTSYIPIFHPYFGQVADHCNFRFINKKIQLTIHNDYNQFRTQNYSKLFELNNSYQQANIYADLLLNKIIQFTVNRYSSDNIITGETKQLRLERIFKSVILDERQYFVKGIGGVPKSKLSIDLCDEMLSEPNYSIHLTTFQAVLNLV